MTSGNCINSRVSDDIKEQLTFDVNIQVTHVEVLPVNLFKNGYEARDIRRTKIKKSARYTIGTSAGLITKNCKNRGMRKPRISNVAVSNKRETNFNSIRITNVFRDKIKIQGNIATRVTRLLTMLQRLQ